MNYGSVCSGIEAASVAWEPLGFNPAWFAQFDPEHDYSKGPDFPSAVLAHHWPDVKNHGDMTKLAAKVLTGTITAPEIIVGGTPCQAFSVAGLRQGLDDTRGQLTIKYVELADATDVIRRKRGKPETIIVWENVPGVLSDKQNAFGCFLGALCGESDELQPSGRKWTNAGCVYGPKRTVAWRVLDAQYFGLAQRRKRVFVVASARNGFDPCEVLFERNSMRRDIAPSREKREDITGPLEARTRSGGFPGTDGAISRHIQPVARCLRARPNSSHSEDSDNFIVEVIHGTQDPIINDNLAFPIGRNNGGENIVYPIHDKATRNEGKTGKGSGNGLGVGTEHDPCPTLTVGDKHAVFSFKCGQGAKAGGIGYAKEQSPTLLAAQSGSQQSPGLLLQNSVRRLMPIEGERLQGFPDNHTQIPWAGKPAEECPDGHRYKAIGNSMAVYVMRWLGVRIKHQIQSLEIAA